MKVKIYKSHDIEVGDLVDFGDGDYRIVVAQYDCTNGISYGLLDLDNNQVSTKFYSSLSLLRQNLDITLVAKKNDLTLVCGKEIK